MKNQETFLYLKIGCCGLGMSLAQYQEKLAVVEVQQTFYQPPKIETLQKWRALSPDSFEFAIKAWQLITHSALSPTYRRIKRPLTNKEKNDAGSFRLTPIVKDALKVTYDCAEALNAKSILFQCPKSFQPTKINQNRLRRFFSSIERPLNRRFYWEPRGQWSADLIFKLCEELTLFHAVDPLLSSSVTPSNAYYRLHGIGSRRYVYADDDLKKLRTIVETTHSDYVFFNNTSMVDDAVRFKTLLTTSGGSSSNL